eukprot:2565751-Prymnesium_polylepis.1
MSGVRGKLKATSIGFFVLSVSASALSLSCSSRSFVELLIIKCSFSDRSTVLNYLLQVGKLLRHLSIQLVPVQSEERVHHALAEIF